MEKMLSAILIGNNIVNLSASALATTLAIHIHFYSRNCDGHPDGGDSDFWRDRTEEHGND